MKKWVYPLLIAFVAFFIFSNPERAGAQGRSFVIWVGDLAGAAGDFLDGLFDETSDDNTNFVPDSNGGDGSGSGDGNGNGAGTSDDDSGDGGDDFSTLAPLTSSERAARL